MGSCALRGCLTLTLAALLLVVGAAAAGRLSQPAPPAAPPSASPASAPAQDLDARLAGAEAAIRQNAAAGKHVPVSFTVTDAELTARANQALASGEVQAPVTGIQVQAVPGRLLIHGRAKVSIAAVPFTLTATPQVAGGKAQLQVVGVDFGGVPVPGPLAAQLTSAVGSDNLLGDLPLTVTSFRAEEGHVVLEGTT